MLDKETYKQSESSLANQFLLTKRAHQKPSQANKDRGQEVHSVFVLMHEVTVSFPQWQAGFEAFSTGWGNGNKEKGEEVIAPGNRVLGMQEEGSVQRKLNQIGRMKRFS